MKCKFTVNKYKDFLFIDPAHDKILMVVTYRIMYGKEEVTAVKKDRPTIGFFTCHLDNSYAIEVCKGVMYAAKEADVNLVIYPGMFLNASYNDPVNARFDYQYNSIFYYATPDTLDALIVSIGSIGSFLSVQDKKAFLDHFNVPILTLEIEVPGYPCLYTESSTGMREVLEHIIKGHKKTRIGFVSGRLENADAKERFDVYKEVLKENGIDFDEKLIAYGDFSEYTEAIVDKLLDDNPDIEAIVFANDQMAIGGYKAINRRGLLIGKDILVTGFDNSVNSISQFPPLTTVDNNLMDLGYNSIYQSLELIKTGHTTMNVLHSQYIPRQSCPADPLAEKLFIEDINRTVSGMDSATLLNRFKNYYMKEHLSSFFADRLFSSLDPFFSIFTEIATGSLDTYSTDDVINSLNTLYTDPIIQHYFSTTRMTNAISKLSEFLTMLDLDEHIGSRLSEFFAVAVIQLSYRLERSNYEDTNRYKVNIWNSENITKDTLISNGNEAQCFHLILDKLNQKGLISSYIYLYDKTPVRLLSDGFWKIPDTLIFEACSKKGVITTFGHDNLIDVSRVFKNEYTETGERSTLVVTPIFTNDEQHGLFVCEADLDTFSHVYSSCLQLGTSLKFIKLIKQQHDIQSRLEATMGEINIKNDLLNNLYITDELTKLYNRHGFFDITQESLANPYNSGHKALFAYIDMDNLKQVNDIFGHKEGDFALTNISDILRKSFPDGSIIARFGGDEFVAFAMDIDDYTIESIIRTLEYNSSQLNETSGKPYYIEFSYGFTDFISRPDLRLEDVMIKADEALYVNKRYKRKSVQK